MPSPQSHRGRFSTETPSHSASNHPPQQQSHLRLPPVAAFHPDRRELPPPPFPNIRSPYSGSAPFSLPSYPSPSPSGPSQWQTQRPNHREQLPHPTQLPPPHRTHQQQSHPPPSATPPSRNTQYLKTEEQQPPLPRYNNSVQLTPKNEKHPEPVRDVDDSLPPTSDFVKKLFKMLEDNSEEHVVSWGPTGDCFVVKDMTEFTKVILPRMFKHSNFASFVRQLNKYDFHKVKNNEDPTFGEHSWTFKHPDFQANNKDALENIKRKVPASRKPAGTAAASTSKANGNDRPSPGQPSPRGRSSVDSLPPNTTPATSSVRLETAPPASNNGALHNQINELRKVNESLVQRVNHLETRYERVMNEVSTLRSNLLHQDGTIQNVLQYFVNATHVPGKPMSPMASGSIPNSIPLTHDTPGTAQSRPQTQVLPTTLASQQQLDQYAFEASQFVQAEEAQKMMTSSYTGSDAVAQASLEQMNELSRMAQSARMNFAPSGVTMSGPTMQEQSMAGQQQLRTIAQPQLQSNAPIASVGPSGSATMAGEPDTPSMEALQNLQRARTNSGIAAHISDAKVGSQFAPSVADNALAPSFPFPTQSSLQTAMNSSGGLMTSPASNHHTGLEVITVGHLVPRPPNLASSSAITFDDTDSNSNSNSSDREWQFEPRPNETRVSSTSKSKSKSRVQAPMRELSIPPPASPPSLGGADPRQLVNDDGMYPPSPTSSSSLSPPGPPLSAKALGKTRSKHHPPKPSPPSGHKLRVRRSTFVPGWAVPPRVLLVEDDLVSRRLSSKFLQVSGCTIDVAVDGVGAVNQMILEKYDLVLMDIVMPKLDGVSATNLIRQFDHMTPIISMTSNSKPKEILTYYSSGMNDVLPKPFTKEGLFTMLERHLMHLKAIRQVTMIPPGLPGSLTDNSLMTALTLPSGTASPDAARALTPSPSNAVVSSSDDAANDQGRINPLAGLGLSDEQYSSMLQGLLGMTSESLESGVSVIVDDTSGTTTMASTAVAGPSNAAAIGPPSSPIKRPLEDDGDGRLGKKSRFEVIE